ncbi:beta-ketoacyl synthase chain length factor [Marinobacterium sp. D7]|uniref:beta-ketoacyl synthase chain length factor n=1 Tax=Marinobacterium ramblicola TaxID=2849041 RepID=UPI001C2DCDD8|nr:beta-ketoacyl synthase chain length factor [Marinobacterium ramblicola]MBV1788295.1 beta-ketoacyl synthase chain length factor [Marinobacterium ramblicola]
MSFKLQSWNAVAPGLESKAQWRSWLERPFPLSSDLHKVSLTQVSPILRRRFTELGRCAASAALPLLENIDAVPGVFASRHGDTPLTLSLLEGIAEDQPMSPTGFSLAVHNAVAGLLSIARKDVSEATSIAATENLIPLALLEAVTRLQEHEQVLCIIYDVPLPELYRPYAESESYPFALAMRLSRREGVDMVLEHGLHHQLQSEEASDLLRVMRLLCDLDGTANFRSGSGVGWSLRRKADAREN